MSIRCHKVALFALVGAICAGLNPSAVAQTDSMPTALDSAYWVADSGISLYHFESGQGRPVVVVHGGPGLPFAEPLPGLKPLENRFRFVYYDQRGCGRSTRPIDSFPTSSFPVNMGPLTQSLGFDTHLRDIETIRTRLGQDKLILIGHSFGGFMATLYAAEHPENVAALVLVAPANMLVFPPEEEDLFETIFRHLPDSQKTAFEDWRVRYFHYQDIFARSEKYLTDVNCEMIPFYVTAARAAGVDMPSGYDCSLVGGWMVHAIYLSMGMSFDHRDKLRRIHAPALVLHGSADLQTEKATRSYVEALPEAEFAVIEGAGHFMFLSHPEKFAEVVGAFLDELR